MTGVIVISDCAVAADIEAGKAVGRIVKPIVALYIVALSPIGKFPGAVTVTTNESVNGILPVSVVNWAA